MPRFEGFDGYNWTVQHKNQGGCDAGAENRDEGILHRMEWQGKSGGGSCPVIP